MRTELAGDPLASGPPTALPDAVEPLEVGVIPGEGVGPALTAAAVAVLEAAARAEGRDLRLSYGPPVSRDGLSPALAEYLRHVFERGGAVLAGAVGGRFVYELRRELDLYCKIVPVRPWRVLLDGSPLRREHVEDVDLVVVRENIGGIYQGRAHSHADSVEHTFSYTRAHVRRIVAAAAEVAGRRRGRLAVVLKDGGLPEMSALWRSASAEACSASGIEPRFIDVDLCAYELVGSPREFDVIVAPNLMGDVLADLSALLLGGRGMSFSGNFSPAGDAVYQTNHGAAFDLVDLDAANPVGQFSAAAMLARESAGAPAIADRIEHAIDAVWRSGVRTRDVARAGDHVVGTRAFTEAVLTAIAEEPTC